MALRCDCFAAGKPNIYARAALAIGHHAPMDQSRRAPDHSTVQAKGLVQPPPPPRTAPWVATGNVVVLVAEAAVRPSAPAPEGSRPRRRGQHQLTDKLTTPLNTYALSCSLPPPLRAIRRHSKRSRVCGMMSSFLAWTTQLILRHKSGTRQPSGGFTIFGSTHQICERFTSGQ